MWFVEQVIVQGEIDVHLANEAREEELARIAAGQATAQEIGMDVESQGVINGTFSSPLLFPSLPLPTNETANRVNRNLASIVDPQLVHALRPIDPSLNVHHTVPPPPPSSATPATTTVSS